MADVRGDGADGTGSPDNADCSSLLVACVRQHTGGIWRCFINASDVGLVWILWGENVECPVWLQLCFRTCSWLISHNQHKQPSCTSCQESQQPKIYIIGTERFSRRGRGGVHRRRHVAGDKLSRSRVRKSFLTNANEGRFCLITAHVGLLWQQRQEVVRGTI